MAGRAFYDLTDFEDYENFGNQTRDLNGTVSNSTVDVTQPLTNGEVLTVSIVGLLGFSGILMNIGVLAVVYKGRLVKKDYRMLYYIFMTSGDLMFALHTFINACSILFRDFHGFKIFAVCLNIQVILGVTSYQWSAICIILLIVDLTWSVKYPFSQDKNKKLFSKIGCIGTFFSSIALSITPFIYWNDSPAELAFCSIGNVYGIHWDFYQTEAVTFLTILLLSMSFACLSLLLVVYRTNTTRDEPNPGPRALVEPETCCHSPHPRMKHRVVSISETVQDQAKTAIHCIKVMEGKLGQTNPAFEKGDEGDKNGGPSPCKQPKDVSSQVSAPQHNGDKNGQADDQYTQAEVGRRTFIRACRTVGFFVASYIGCCLPYYVLLCMGIGCGNHCTEDTPDERRVRAIVAAALYLLPIIDPILYIKRFKLFNETLAEIFRKLCRR